MLRAGQFQPATILGGISHLSHVVTVILGNGQVQIGRIVRTVELLDAVGCLAIHVRNVGDIVKPHHQIAATLLA